MALNLRRINDSSLSGSERAQELLRLVQKRPGGVPMDVLSSDAKAAAVVLVNTDRARLRRIAGREFLVPPAFHKLRPGLHALL